MANYFSTNLKKIRENKGLSQNKLGSMVGVNQTTIARWENKEIAPSIDNVEEISKVFDIPLFKLLGEDLRFDNASPIELDDNMVSIPVLGVIKAGIPIEAQQDIIEYIEIPKKWTLGGKYFYGLKVSGDSMSPKYNDNDIVIFEQNNDYNLANNKDCAVMVNGNDATFKKVKITVEGSVIMRKKEITDRLQTSLNNSIPNQFDEILLKCQKKKGKIIMNEVKNNKEETKPSKKKTNLIPRLSVAFAVVLVALGITYFGYNASYKVDSIIELDVNPSIELKVNKNEEVIEAIAQNEEAKQILKDMDLEKTDIDVALNAIIGSMVTNGYIDELANSILLTVENDDSAKGEELRQRLVAQINKILGSDQINGSVLSQNLSEADVKAQELAEKYNISLGKANLILDILNSNSLLTEQDLVGLSINELNVLSEEKANNLNTVSKEGTASTKSYIGKTKARQIALNHAGVSNPNYIEVEFDADDGLIIYEVEFNTSSREYEYEIDAKTGDIIYTNYEPNDDNYNYSSSNNSTSSSNNSSSNSNSSSSNRSSTSTSSNYISSSKARQIALNHAGATSSTATRIHVELDREDNEYQVEFIYNNREYDYEINATTGKILDYDSERLDND